MLILKKDAVVQCGKFFRQKKVVVEPQREENSLHHLSWNIKVGDTCGSQEAPYYVEASNRSE